jgi:hypothetical protein
LSSDPRLTLAGWTTLPEAEKTAAAQEVADALGEQIHFHSLASVGRGDRERRIARFEYRFADDRPPLRLQLIPAGEVALGLDDGMLARFAVDITPVDSWRWAFAAWVDGQAGSRLPAEERDRMFTPRRTVTLAPFLIAPDALHPSDYTARAGGPRRGSGHAGARKTLAADGLRLPTADEWEYACSGGDDGAGAPTIFHWGDTIPARLPARHDLPYNTTEGDGGDENGDERIEMEPNGFGLRIAFDPYDLELVTGPDEFRGGDGGVAICGGDGLFRAWICLASAHRFPGRGNGQLRPSIGVPG